MYINKTTKFKSVQ